MPSDPPAEETKADADVPVVTTTEAEPSVEQDAVAAETLALPAMTESEALSGPVIEQSFDNIIQTETAPANENASLDNTVEKPAPEESAAILDANVAPTPEALSFDDSKDIPAPESTSNKDFAAVEVDARETPAVEEAVDVESLPTKKSKKDKKKNKKAQTLDIEEPSNATPESTDNQITAEESAKVEESSVTVENSSQDASQPEADLTSAPEEPAAQINDPVPAEPEEDFGAFPTKKARKTRKRARKEKLQRSRTRQHPLRHKQTPQQAKFPERQLIPRNFLLKHSRQPPRTKAPQQTTTLVTPTATSHWQRRPTN